MKTILLSVRPEWVEKILNGEKTIEMRLTFPKCELPCNVVIYCTKTGMDLYYNPYFGCDEAHYVNQEPLNGKVVGEFTLNKIMPYGLSFLSIKNKDGSMGSDIRFMPSEFTERKHCLTQFQLLRYANGKSMLYGWFIDDLKIYDKPKTLQDFGKEKAPQSWCFVKEQ